ncbi:hypothetical protein GGI21_005652, partial [Coemansia aciculifera]
MFAAEFVRLSDLDLSEYKAEDSSEFVLNLTLAFVLLRESLLTSNDGEANGLAVVRVDGDPRLYARVEAAAQAMQEIASNVIGSALTQEKDSSFWLATLAQHAIVGGESESEDEGVWARIVSKGTERCTERGGAWALVLGTVAEWAQWAQPLASADLEYSLADSLARHVEAAIEPSSASHSAMLVVVCRATSLRRRCSHSPAMRSALLDSAKHAANAVERCSGSPVTLLRLIAALELLSELIPADCPASLDAVTTKKIATIVLAVPDVLASCPATGDGGSTNHAALVVAAFLVLQRLAECMSASLEEDCV